ncbi:putative ubie ubiquinone menaquinone biosynthesis methyltransferase protein [Eutypa lata UCREL1]|uniref:Putative ubie ubiquinone menaquinone biosynthesis methyltransferase protein n=1 Tax=Eutypa lata (strain UCR-EL1) TaxID=1287681 RepID=M7TLK4_EUTLA|nr:putative ubie ubiquinone menaquinone biosynthesis methyltransferase protein [Eutypa lata UCREL1]
MLATEPSNTIKIYATDIAPPMVGIYNNVASAGNWASRAIVMDAQKLSFPDSTFSHVFLSFGLRIIEDPIASAREMCRTLKPGGIAITAFWLQILQGECAVNTRHALYEKSAFLPVKDFDGFALAVWSAIGQSLGGWTKEDEEKWNVAVA